MWLIYIFSACSAVVVVYSIVAIVRGFNILKDPEATKRENIIALIVLLFIGSLGLLSTIPGIFGENWYWFTDKLFTLVSYVI